MNLEEKKQSLLKEQATLAYLKKDHINQIQLITKRESEIQGQLDLIKELLPPTLTTWQTEKRHGKKSQDMNENTK